MRRESHSHGFYEKLIKEICAPNTLSINDAKTESRKISEEKLSNCNVAGTICTTKSNTRPGRTKGSRCEKAHNHNNTLFTGILVLPVLLFDVCD